MREPVAIVTGGAGFIGSNLVDRLIQENYSVVVIDDLSSGCQTNLRDAEKSGENMFKFEEQDICSSKTTALIADLKPEVVFHLAAQTDVRHSVADPVFDAEVNILGTLRVLEGARLGKIQKVVVAASGGTLYGEPDPSFLPLKESLPPNPLSPYGVSKTAMIYYLSVYRHLYGLDSTVLTMANVYGPRQDPHGEAGVVSIFAEQLLSEEGCKIFGTGEQTRDFVYVEDVIEALILASQAPGLGIINIGTGIETSINDLYQAMSSIMETTSNPKYEPSRLGEVERSVLDPTYAKSSLGWVSTTSLVEGLSRSIEWFKEN